MPRLSVDIDLTHLPVRDRAESLADINETLAGLDALRIDGGGGATRIRARLGGAEVKIETSTVTRGVVHEPEERAVSAAVEDEFGYAAVQVVSFEDLFSGKLHAAMDRQHPCALFDVKLLYEKEGLTDQLFRTFLVYVASSPRPAHELLRPSLSNLDEHCAREFVGMTTIPVTLDDLIVTRERLIGDIGARRDRSTIVTEAQQWPQHSTYRSTAVTAAPNRQVAQSRSDFGPRRMQRNELFEWQDSSLRGTKTRACREG